MWLKIDFNAGSLWLSIRMSGPIDDLTIGVIVSGHGYGDGWQCWLKMSEITFG